jgi:hypothetical protein
LTRSRGVSPAEQVGSSVALVGGYYMAWCSLAGATFLGQDHARFGLGLAFGLVTVFGLRGLPPERNGAAFFPPNFLATMTPVRQARMARMTQRL